MSRRSDGSASLDPATARQRGEDSSVHEEFLFAVDGAVARLTFNRPDARNAMTWNMYERLAEACDRLGSDRSIRVAVLSGAGGKAFVAGTDIGQFATFTDGESGIAYEARMDEIIGSLASVPIPTIAAIDGWAVGGGLAIAAACDWRVATPASRFGIPIARTLGNCLSMRGYARLVWMIGPTRTTQMLLGADFFDAEQAMACGLVTEVVEAEQLSAHVGDLAERLCHHAPLSMQASKAAVRRIVESGLPDGDDLVRLCYGSEDFHEGVQAFSAKRAPEWRGA